MIAFGDRPTQGPVLPIFARAEVVRWMGAYRRSHKDLERSRQ